MIQVGDEIEMDPCIYRHVEGKTFKVNYITSSGRAFTVTTGEAFSTEFARLVDRKGIYEREDWS